VAAHEGQAIGRHERRPHLVGVSGHHATPSRRATRGARSRHAARPGWAVWAERAGRFAGQAREWWAEGTGRVAARARERWAERVAGAQRTRPGGPVPALRSVAAGPGAGSGHESRAGHGSAGYGSGSRAAQPRAADPAPRHLAGEPRSRRASWREDVMSGWCSLLLVLGLYLDGWHHINLLDDGLGPFLTPWHGVLYAGFAATAAWILTRHQRRGAWSLRAVPPGYRLALVGMGLAGDAVWHTLYGSEQGLARLISPFHLVLFCGACLLVSSALMWPPAVPLTAWNRGRAPARSPAAPTPMRVRMVGR
jgi:hypothetical protein